MSRVRSAVRVPTLPVKSHPPAAFLSIDDSRDLLSGFLQRPGKTCIITGAGVSVDSGVRAYRGPNGSYTRAGKEHRPIFYGEFVESSKMRRRYWARSYLGYPPVRLADANPTHYAVAALQEMGVVDSLITQNVDGLHHKALDEATFASYIAGGTATTSGTKSSLDIPASHSSTPDILELHGTLRHVHCLSCKTEVGRDGFQDLLNELNPAWRDYLVRLDEGKTTSTEQRLNPDGDVELGDGTNYEDFIVPPCSSCGGPMKPKVTFFGESLEPHVRDKSLKYVAEADNLLIIGSSLATFSAFRLIAAFRAAQVARSGTGQIGLMNIGESRGDAHVDWRIGWEGGAGDILPEAARRLFGLRRSRLNFSSQRQIEIMLRSGIVKSVAPGMATA